MLLEALITSLSFDLVMKSDNKLADFVLYMSNSTQFIVWIWE